MAVRMLRGIKTSVLSKNKENERKRNAGHCHKKND